MSTCRRRTIQLSKNLEYRKRRFSPDLLATETANIGRQPADAEFDARVSLLRQPARRRKCEPQTQPQTQHATTCLGGATPRHSLLPALFGLLGIWLATGGKVLVGVAPTCFKPYPKAFFVSTSRLCQHPQEAPYSRWQLNTIPCSQAECKRNFSEFFPIPWAPFWSRKRPGIPPASETV